MKPNFPLLPALLGLLGFALPLAFLKLGAAQFWAPFETTGSQLYRALLFSAFCGALALVAAKMRPRPFIAGTLGALTWGLWAFPIHIFESGTFRQYLPAGTTPQGATTLFFANAISQGVCVAFGVVLSSAAFWAINRFLRKGEEDAPAISTQPRPFQTALSYPIVVAVLGIIFTSVLSLPLLARENPSAFSLPSPAMWAILANGIALAGFGLGGFCSQKWFPSASAIGFLVAPPLAVAGVAALFLASSGQIAPLEPFARLVWNASGFEIACFGAFGASLGRVLALHQGK